MSLQDCIGTDPTYLIRVNWPSQRVTNYYPMPGEAIYPAPKQNVVYSSNELSAIHETLIKNTDGTYDLVEPDQTRYHFVSTPNTAGSSAPSARLDAIISSKGQAISLTYADPNATSNPIKATDVVSGKSLVFAYDGQGNLIGAMDPLGRQARLIYSSGVSGIPDAIQVLSPTGQIVKSTTYTYDQWGELLTATDMDGRIIMSNTYDYAARVITQIDGRAGVMQLAYQTASDGSNITSVTDRTGKTHTYKFDSNFLLLEHDDPTGRVESWQCNGNGDTVAYTNKNGHSTAYSRDSNGNILTVTDPANQVTTMTYDSLNRIMSMTDPRNDVTTYSYDGRNNVVQITDPLGGVTTQVWDNNSLLLSKKLPRGGTESYTYAGGLLTSNTDANGNTWTYGYDAAGRRVASQDPTQAVTNYGYDALDHLTSVTDPLNHTRVYAYNSREWKLAETDPSGNTTQFQYDGNGNLISRIDPAPWGTTTYQYDGEDRLIQITDPLGNSVSYGRDAAGRLISVTDGRGKSQTFQVDGLGHTINAFDAYGQLVAQNYYDTRELLEETTDGVGRINNWDYDQRGAPIQFVDGLSNVTTFANDALKRLTQSTTPLGNVTAQGFDPDGNRIGLSNGLGNGSGFSFDLGGRLSSVTTASNLTTQYTYNSRNLVETITRPSGQKTTNIYDPALRLSQVIDSYATTVFQYDANGRPIETDDNANGGAKTTRAYDSLGRLTSYTDEMGNTIGYGYDPAGNLIRLTYPDGKVVTYNYDQNNRLTTVTDWAGRITTYSYDDNGRLATTAFPNQTQETRTYDVSGTLTGVQALDPSGNQIYGCAYQIDAAGRVTSAALNPAPTSFSVPTATMSFDADNRLTEFDGMAVYFDSDGNMTNGPSVRMQVPTVYSYDARNRLTASGRVGYYYNPDGRRTTLTDYTRNINGVATNFVIDPSGRLDRTLVRAKGGTLTYYVYGLGLIGQEQDGVYQNYHFDSRGSTVAITDSSGSVTDRFEYGPYGEPLSHNGTTDTPFQFNGRYGVQTDPNGLLYMRSRYYNPAIRRFVNQDVLFGQINSEISLNRFAFANGNPISLMDSFGLCASSDNFLTRLNNLAGAADDQIFNTIIDAIQSLFYIGGEASAADELNNLRNPYAQLGLYNPNSPIVQPTQGVVDNVIGDVAIFGGLSSIIGGGLAADSAATETFYRTMSPANYEQLLNTGKIPATGETFISPSLQYAQQYNGVTVQFSVQAGTTESLLGMGVRNAGLKALR